MRKIRLIIEVDLDERSVIDAEVIKKAWGGYSNYPKMLENKEWMEGVKHEQAMLDALRANPKQFRESIIASLFSEVADMGYKTFYEMTGVPTEYSGTLRSLIPLLPVDSAAFFRDMDEKDVLSENTELVNGALTLSIKKIDVEGL